MTRSIALAILATAGMVAAQGAVIGSFPSPSVVLPVGLDHDGAGNLLFTGIGTVDEIGVHDTAGVLISSSTTIPNSVNPIGITTDGTNLYVTDTSTGDVDIYDLAYNYISSFGTTTTFPEGIAFRPVNSHLYVVDGTASFVQEYDLAGNQIAIYPVNGTSVDGIAWSPLNDSFWVYDSGTDTVRNYDVNFVELSNFPGTVAAGYSNGEGLGYINGIVYVCAPSSGVVVAFDSLGNAAENTLYGAGCPQPALFYEVFGTFDLANTAIQLQPNIAGGWTVTSSNDTWDPTFTNNLLLGDDALATGQPLGFTIGIPGVGPVSTVDIDSNGRLGWGLTGSDYTESVGEFIVQNLLCPFWDDLNPNNGGGVYFDAMPNYTMVTWDSVPEYSSTGANSAQVKFYPQGIISIIWGPCSLADCLTGFSDASGIDPGALDISSAIPFVSGGSGLPLGLSASARPIINTTISLNVSGVSGTTVAGAVICGFNQLNLGLGSIGAIGCSLYSSGDMFTIGFTPASPSVTIPIPNDVNLNGLSLFWQGAAIDPPANTLGVTTSNGLKTKFGPF